MKRKLALMLVVALSVAMVGVSLGACGKAPAYLGTYVQKATAGQVKETWTVASLDAAGYKIPVGPKYYKEADTTNTQVRQPKASATVALKETEAGKYYKVADVKGYTLKTGATKIDLTVKTSYYKYADNVYFAIGDVERVVKEGYEEVSFIVPVGDGDDVEYYLATDLLPYVVVIVTIDDETYSVADILAIEGLEGVTEEYIDDEDLNIEDYIGLPSDIMDEESFLYYLLQDILDAIEDETLEPTDVSENYAELSDEEGIAIYIADANLETIASVTDKIEAISVINLKATTLYVVDDGAAYAVANTTVEPKTGVTDIAYTTEANGDTYLNSSYNWTYEDGAVEQTSKLSTDYFLYEGAYYKLTDTELVKHYSAADTTKGIAVGDTKSTYQGGEVILTIKVEEKGKITKDTTEGTYTEKKGVITAKYGTVTETYTIVGTTLKSGTITLTKVVA